ncbi:hypothetical protein [Alteromonas sp. 14N.309.X.WAT.G.H12]|uniref:hypothetical protein n=1 Tax=Alteromonas sp. 14N.309.X.WAT.G.H12 TaxID=3120824 RepID=UPI002FD11E66
MFVIRGLSTVLCGSIFMLSGCSSAPDPVYANIPLVSGNKLRLIDTQTLPVPQGTLSTGSVVQIADTQYQVVSSYQSATGLACKQLLSLQDKSTYRAVCLRNGEWQLLAPLLSHVDY